MSFDPREKKAYLEASPAQREVVRRLLCNLLGLLRAQYLSYQTSHWQVVGNTYYGNHLLFQRLYESVQDQIDQLAEKLVGYLGIDSVDLVPQTKQMASYIGRWTVGLEITCHHERGIQSEKDCQAAIQTAYDGIKAAQAMTLGLDDWLMATANAHEENQYLLQQVLTQPPGRTASLVNNWFKVGSGAPTREDEFFPEPRHEEVLNFADSGAISNNPEIAGQAADEDRLDESKATAVADAEAAPPTPIEIKAEPGGEAVSTLNRYVVTSEDPVAEKAVAMNRARMAAWLKEVEGSE